MYIPQGFQFAGRHCGIKTQGPDLCLIVCDSPCTATGVYTQNVVRAACIDWNRQVTPTADARAVVINSGNANACTGQQGAADCRAMARAVASNLGCDARQVCILSTGVIGQYLPMDQVIQGIEKVSTQTGNSPEHFLAAAGAMLTTDRASKIASKSLTLGGQNGSIAAMAKGAGMIGPNMATMLAVVMTDFWLAAETADRLLRTAVNHSFNRISVEGHTSTNDAVILLNSRIGELIKSGSAQARQFSHELNSICLELAKQIPADGEGATKLIEVSVLGATNDADADQIARTIAASALVKTAVTGCDPNWGRIVSAAGYASKNIDLPNCFLSINGHRVFDCGRPAAFDERTVSNSMTDNPETVLELCVGDGPGTGKHWTSNLTTDYVRLNSDYRT